jgi:hypothetical protein
LRLGLVVVCMEDLLDGDTDGQALWTGVVVVAFLQIWPEAKRRQYQQALDAYEAAAGRQARAGSGQAPDAAGAGEGCQ